MLKLRFHHKILLAVFFLVLITSLWPNNIYLLVLFSLLTYVILPIRKYWDNMAFMLVLFSLFYSMMAVMTKQSGSGSILISYIISPVAFYRFGRWLLTHFYAEIIRQKLILLIISCYLLSLFIITIKDIALVGIVNSSRVMLGDINGGDSLAATLYGLMASVGIGCVSALFIKGQSSSLRLSFIVLSIFSVLVVVHLVNRTGLVVLLACVLVSFIISTRMKMSKIIPALFLIGILAILIVNTRVINDEMIDAYQQREMDSSFDATQLGGRTAIWADAVRKLATHPLGWELVRYAHNLWLDIARVGGWITLFLFLIATINWFKKIHSLIRKQMTPFIQIIISINVAMYLSSFVEPVIDGSMLFFSLFMMIWGCTVNLSKEIIVNK